MKPLHLPFLSRATLPVDTTPEVTALLAAGVPVAFGVSGGIDGAAAAIRTNEHLDAVGHRGSRVLIHSDLGEGPGEVEWEDSLPSCRRLAEYLGLELIVVRHGQGGLMSRWERRWASSVGRYANLECVKLILPWSTASMRFCTSEMKTDLICRELRRRFRGGPIISVTGIRRDESPKRAKSPIAKRQEKLSDAGGTWGLDWHPGLSWSKQECFELCSRRGVAAHEAYGRFGLSRVSCKLCILASAADLAAASRVEANAPLCRRIAELEITSTFSFRSDGWIADIAAAVLSADQLARLGASKKAALLREEAESAIPDHLLYTKGWPTCIPTQAEAELLCGVRVAVAKLVGLSIQYSTPRSLISRYEELMAAKRRKGAA